MRHWVFPARTPQARTPGAPPLVFWVLACSVSAASAQGFDNPLSAAEPPRLPPLALTLRPSLPSTLPWHTGDDIGLSWRARLAADKMVDITAWRRLPRQPFDAISQIQQRDPLYGARLEMKLAPPRSGFTTELRAIGLQLDNGARILLRRKDGNPTLYYRQQF
ncbi:hypothetical protein PE066_01410 [Ramlibacter tataouinensis]|uniref:hypothetical protein n=1 Tax=Ramlibacter tataouinensis TaxID=94132 RepID=UPI0022F3AF63|nr:hypothetical protein [Ramlibacter tataouinensis]WBY02217.1 hypothetical protein PE066_01410 [Ramlibacter tataouinensis]